VLGGPRSERAAHGEPERPDGLKIVDARRIDQRIVDLGQNLRFVSVEGQTLLHAIRNIEHAAIEANKDPAKPGAKPGSDKLDDFKLN